MKKLFFLIILILLPSQINAQQKINYFTHAKPEYPIECIDTRISLLSYSNMARRKNYPTGKIISILGIKEDPDLNILDIGAGEGYFSIPFAKALNNGKVYATDLELIHVENLKNYSKKENLKNLFPVLVSGKGSDAFYQNNSFDIIFLCDVYYQMTDHINFFSEIKKSLKDNGRIFIIQPKKYVDLYAYIDPQNNGAFIPVINSLKEQDNSHPIIKRLTGQTLTFIRTWDDEGIKAIPIEQRENLLKELNNMLEDKNLLFDFLYYYDQYSFNKWPSFSNKFSKYSYLLHYLATNLLENNVFESKEELNEKDKNTLFFLNNLIIRESLKISHNTLEYIIDPSSNFIENKESIIQKMSYAGYDFSTEYELPYHVFLEFKHKN